MSDLVVPFFSPLAMHAAIREEVVAAMSRVYDSQWYILGQELAQFEQAYSAFNRVAHTIGVGSGLEA
ncbi:MAG: aminotransferase, partial [Cytophagaceae bacterium]